MEKTEGYANYDREIVKSFIHPNKHERYFSLLGDPKKRRKLLQRLGHQRDLDESSMMPLPKSVQTRKDLVAFLKKNGAVSECYILSDQIDLDGKLLPIESAIDHIFGMGFGSIVYCPPQGIGYFEGEGKSERYLLINPRLAFRPRE